MLYRIPEANLMITEVSQKDAKNEQMFYLMALKQNPLEKLKNCVEKLETCLRIDPDMKCAQKLCSKAKKIWELYQEGKHERQFPEKFPNTRKVNVFLKKFVP